MGVRRENNLWDWFDHERAAGKWRLRESRVPAAADEARHRRA